MLSVWIMISWMIFDFLFISAALLYITIMLYALGHSYDFITILINCSVLLLTLAAVNSSNNLFKVPSLVLLKPAEQALLSCSWWTKIHDAAETEVETSCSFLNLQMTVTCFPSLFTPGDEMQVLIVSLWPSTQRDILQ